MEKGVAAAAAAYSNAADPQRSTLRLAKDTIEVKDFFFFNNPFIASTFQFLS